MRAIDPGAPLDAEANKLLANRCFRYALSLTHDRPTAEDLVQEAWSLPQLHRGRAQEAL